MNVPVLLLILGMSLATFLTRALPAALVNRFAFRGRLLAFLRLVPYTALAALIFPGILRVDEARPEIGLAGGLAALLLALWKRPLILCVAGAIGVDLLIYLLL